MKIKQILATAKKNKLSDRDLELLLALVLKQTRIFVLSNPDYELSLNQEKKFAVLLKKCLNHYPLAYLSGQQEFYGLNFKVNPNTLIPRPETELIVDYILDNFKELNNKQSLSLIDVGTGSGCIICALAKNLPGQNLYLGLDISGPALKIAKLNAKLNQVDHKTKFIKSDLLTSLLNPGQFALLSSRQLNLSNTGQSKSSFSQPDKLKPLIIVANLPYLSPKQIRNSPSIKYEPKRALDGGADGLKYYKKILPQILNFLDEGFKNIVVIFEIDPGQNKTLGALIHRTFTNRLKSLKTKNDLAWLNRFIVIELTNK